MCRTFDGNIYMLSRVLRHISIQVGITSTTMPDTSLGIARLAGGPPHHGRELSQASNKELLKLIIEITDHRLRGSHCAIEEPQRDAPTHSHLSRCTARAVPNLCNDRMAYYRRATKRVQRLPLSSLAARRPQGRNGLPLAVEPPMRPAARCRCAASLVPDSTIGWVVVVVP
jgi:hypothetical protein